MAEIIETHAHLDLKAFDGIRDEIFCKMADKGITKVIVPAISLESNQSMREKLNDFSNSRVKIYYAHGIHPTKVPVGCRMDTIKKITNMLKQYACMDNCVAIGETGLDYHKENLRECIAEQKLWFEQQLMIAKELNKPLILHVRGIESGWLENVEALREDKVTKEETNWEREKVPNADEDAIKILKQNMPGNGYRGVIHCFHGDLEIAKQYIDLGFCLGIGGKVTYDEEKELKKTIQCVDLENLVLETDSPYVQLQSVFGKINTPLNLEYVAEKIADIKDISKEEVVKVITDITMKRFRI